ncbi:hypothetical protein [Flavobacterium sp.]|uniref:hypothetical protein n=1 Tax=Flavobacterium sp. TaxID=239 RepID=UPI00260855F5|nr:hypothetical protein [Flavobacterium sp.]
MKNCCQRFLDNVCPQLRLPITAAGIVSGSFTSTEPDQLSFAIVATASTPTSILADDFYAYTVAPNPEDNVTLTSTVWLKDAVRSKLNVWILGRFF